MLLYGRLLIPEIQDVLIKKLFLDLDHLSKMNQFMRRGLYINREKRKRGVPPQSDGARWL